MEHDSEGDWSPWEREDAAQYRPLIAQADNRGHDLQESEDMAMDDTAILMPATKAARTPQYITAFSATMGALAMGAVLGYSSPSGPMLLSPNSSVVLSQDQVNWFSSSMNLGALAGGPVGGLCLNHLGRRGTMLTSSVPFILGWLLIAFGQNFTMLLVGRILTGLCAGITSLTVPTYIGEYASSDVRGTLGSGFQLMVTIGLMYAYVLGAIVNTWEMLAGLCIIPVGIYVTLMIFSKESPSYLLSKGKEEQAYAALQYFRGANYNIQTEVDMMRQSLHESQQNRASLKDLWKPYILKPLLISLCLMFFQQFSGVNGVLFNLNTIFSDSGSKLSDDMSSIIVAGVQVGATFLATILMDKAGRKLLLIISSSIMAFSLVAMGEFFYFKQEDEAWAVATLGWLPLVSLIVFISAFSIGYGPIPWLMIGELFTPNIKELAGGLSTMVNWSLSFIVTLVFIPLQTDIHTYGVYWMFAGICVVNLIFCITTVPETKGKTLEEINAYFGAPTSSRLDRQSSSDC